MKSQVGDQAETEEAGSQPVSGPTGGLKQEPRRFLGLARRDLSEDELATPAARRFLIAEIERLDTECDALRLSASELVEFKVANATLAEAQKKAKWNEILSFACSTLGAVGIGAAPSYFSVATLQPTAWTILVGSALLVIIAVLSKVIR